MIRVTIDGGRVTEEASETKPRVDGPSGPEDKVLDALTVGPVEHVARGRPAPAPAGPRRLDQIPPHLLRDHPVK